MPASRATRALIRCLRVNEPLAGAQLPFGGHKGSALSVMVELLAGAMLGTDLAIDSSEGDHLDDMVRGMAVIAIDPGACEVRHVAKLRNCC